MFARDLRDLSGPWSGFWIQDLVRGHMKLTLRFHGNDIDGEGNDPTGAFRVGGIFSDETGRVLLTKTYRTHTVDYNGLWDGSFIYGRWTISDEEFSETGDFEIWPDRGEEKMTSLAELMREQVVPAH